MTTDNPSMSSQIILPQPLDDREREVFAAIADRDKELAERIEEIDGLTGLNLTVVDGGLSFISNPGFEAGEDDWTLVEGQLGVAEVVSNDRASGIKSLHLSLVAASNVAYAWQSIGAVPAGNYVLQFWTRGDGTDDGRYRVIEQGGSDPIAATPTGVTGTTWELVAAPFVVAGTGIVTVQLLDPDADTSEVWFDDVLVASAITYASLDQVVYQMYRQILQVLGVWDE